MRCVLGPKPGLIEIYNRREWRYRNEASVRLNEKW